MSSSRLNPKYDHGFKIENQGPPTLNPVDRLREQAAVLPSGTESKIKAITELCEVIWQNREEAFDQKGYIMTPFKPLSKWRVIGKGGFATVFRGVRKKDGKTYAIKQMPYYNDKDKGKLMNMINREVRHLQMLKGHENVVQLIDMFASTMSPMGGYFNAVLEYADCGDLFEMVQSSRNYRLTIPVARQMFRQICLGVNFIHGRRLAHLDIKCDNVLMFRSGDDAYKLVPKIGDFGLSLVAWSPANGIIKTKDIHGTRYYLAPELMFNYHKRPLRLKLHSSIWMKPHASDVKGLRDKPPTLPPPAFHKQTAMQRLQRKAPEEITRAKTNIFYESFLYKDDQNPLPCDIWALGCTLYVMVTGNYPFNMEKDMIDLALRGKFIRYHFLPQDVTDFLKMILTPNPVKRPTIRCILDHDWLKESRSVQQYTRKQKPLPPPLPRQKVRSAPAIISEASRQRYISPGFEGLKKYAAEIEEFTPEEREKIIREYEAQHPATDFDQEAADAWAQELLHISGPSPPHTRSGSPASQNDGPTVRVGQVLRIILLVPFSWILTSNSVGSFVLLLCLNIVRTRVGDSLQ